MTDKNNRIVRKDSYRPEAQTANREGESHQGLRIKLFREQSENGTAMNVKGQQMLVNMILNITSGL